MDWYVIYTKPRQELRALVNLEAQGYTCYLPQLKKQKLLRGRLEIVKEPLFPRYLFICLDSSQSGKSWGPIRSTLGVSHLVTFGSEPARIDVTFIQLLQQHAQNIEMRPDKIFQAGDRILINEGPFSGIEAIFEIDDGESRAMVLIDLLSKSTRLKIPIASLSKTRD
jgi:transcriptional antiterminator RfaH